VAPWDDLVAQQPAYSTWRALHQQVIKGEDSPQIMVCGSNYPHVYWNHLNFEIKQIGIFACAFNLILINERMGSL
jgi:hypothetical protein